MITLFIPSKLLVCYPGYLCHQGDFALLWDLNLILINSFIQYDLEASYLTYIRVSAQATLVLKRGGGEAGKVSFDPLYKLQGQLICQVLLLVTCHMSHDT
jgi:hypothetical protein